MKAKILRVMYAMVAILLAYPYIVSAAGVRARLAADSNVLALYAVDESHSFIIGKPRGGMEGRAYRVVKWYSKGTETRPTAYLIEHSPEPIFYKTPHVPDLSKIDSIRDTMIDDDALDTGRRNYSPADVYEHAYALCTKRGGKLAVVVPKQYGSFKRLTLLSAFEGFDYILTNSPASTWYIACEGNKKFRVLKNYSFLTGGKELARVRDGVALEGVDYVVDVAAESERVARLERKPLAEEEFLVQMARELAALRMDFVKPNGGERYYGTYRRGEGLMGCEVVTIKHSPSDDPALTRVFDYSVCKKKVARLSEKEIRDEHYSARKVYVRSGFVTVLGAR